MLTISFRPHHFLCAFCFQGEGYSPEFISNFANIMKYLNSAEGNDAIINVISHTDSICAPCPSKRDKLCVSQKKILLLDQAHADILKIEEGDQITWNEAKKRIHQHMTLEKFDTACSPCAWKKTGMCEKTLRNRNHANPDT